MSTLTTSLNKLGVPGQLTLDEKRVIVKAINSFGSHESLRRRFGPLGAHPSPTPKTIGGFGAEFVAALLRIASKHEAVPAVDKIDVDSALSKIESAL